MLEIKQGGVVSKFLEPEPTPKLLKAR